MDTLVKKNRARQSLQNKLKSQKREIDELKRKLRQMGGVFVDRDGRGTTLQVAMRVDEYSSRNYSQIWDDLMANIAYQLGVAVATEQAKQIFNKRLKLPKELESVKLDWVYTTARNYCVPYDMLNAAWDSAFDAIKQTYQQG